MTCFTGRTRWLCWEGVRAETTFVTALTVGVTTARDPACKRGIATNVAASLARHAATAARVCVVDADPLTLDVTTRLGVRGPTLEDYARPTMPTTGQLARLHSPDLAVVPCEGKGVGRVRFAVERALPELRAGFDVVVCDLPGGPSGPKGASTIRKAGRGSRRRQPLEGRGRAALLVDEHQGSLRPRFPDAVVLHEHAGDPAWGR